MTVTGEQMAALAGSAEDEEGLAKIETLLRELTDLDSESPAPPPGLAGLEEATFFELLGDWAFETGRVELALRSHRRLRELEVEAGEEALGLAFTRGRIGKALAATGDLDGAKAEFQGAIDDATAASGSDDDLACLWIDYGSAMRDAEQGMAAVKAYRQGVAFAEASGQAPEILGRLCRMLLMALKPVIRFLHATDQIQETLRGHLDETVTSELAGYAGNSARFQEEGERVMEKVVAYLRAGKVEEEELISANLELAEIYGYGGKHERAAEIYREALASCEELAPDDPEIGTHYHRFGETLHKLGAHGEAARALERALAKKTANEEPKKSLADSWQLLAEVHTSSGDPKEALEAYQEAVMLLDAVADADRLARVREAIATLSGL